MSRRVAVSSLYPLKILHTAHCCPGQSPPDTAGAPWGRGGHGHAAAEPEPGVMAATASQSGGAGASAGPMGGQARGHVTRAGHGGTWRPISGRAGRSIMVQGRMESLVSREISSNYLSEQPIVEEVLGFRFRDLK